MRGDCLSILDHPAVRTPHLDALASEGALFRRAYTTVPSCIPARRALLTGLFPQTSGVVGYAGRPISSPTMPQLLAEKPLFLTASFYAPHPPLFPPKKYFDYYYSANLPQPAQGDWVDWGALSPKGDRAGHRVLLEGEPLRAAQSGYLGLIEQLDEEIDLFDLDSDPREEHDLAKDAAHRQTLATWRATLTERLAQRPEGFSDGSQLIPGRPYRPLHASRP